MFKGNDGKTSLTKILSCVGFFAFVIVSIAILFVAPEKFDYSLFSIIAGGGGISSQVAGKFLVNKYGGK